MSFKAAIKNNYKQLLFVCVAFFTMAMVSYFYAGSLMKKQIDLLSQSEMQVYKNKLKSLILAHEAALQHTAATIVTVMETGSSPDELQKVLSAMTTIFKEQDDIKDVFVSVYGYLDGNYLDGTSWIPGEFYNPKIAPWMRGALVNNGLFHSEPYIDPRTGNAVSSISMVVFDQKGESRGVLAVDYLLNPIINQVRDYRISDTGYGFLLDASLSVLTFPGSKFIGGKISEVPGFKYLQDDLLKQTNKKDDRVLVKTIYSDEIENIVFFSRLENGWYLGIVVPMKNYYSDVAVMIPFIFILGAVLTAILCIILIRLSEAKAKSEEESRSKSSFLAHMSHELRTPMNAIIGMSELARREYGKQKGLDYIDEICQAGSNMLAIINDVLDLSKIESGNLSLSERPYNVAELFRDVLAIVKIRLAGKAVSLKVSIDPQTPSGLIGDVVRVQQILMNLLSNAIKYTFVGFIKFEVKSKLLPDNNQVKIVFIVEDSGIGIKQENLEILFNDFIRLDKGSPKKIEGTGLGLSIARTLCHAMNGDISVKSEYGRGSVFTATIIQSIANLQPIEEYDEKYSQQARLDKFKVSFTAPGFRVLLVDDVDTNLMVAKGLMEPYQLDISTCQSGREAIKIAGDQDFDLLFIDHMMPGKDGLETMKNLRLMGERFKNIPMIVMTANVLAGMKEMFLANGFDDYLGKPLNIEILDTILQRWIPADVKRTSAGLSGEDNTNKGLRLDIGGLNWEQGVKAIGGSNKKYMEALAIFCRDVEHRKADLNKDYQQDVSSIRLQLHALKSAMSYIGATVLAKEAMLLEAAALQGDLEILNMGLPPFKESLWQLCANITSALHTLEIAEETQSFPSLALESRELLYKLKTAIAEKDIKNIDDLLEEILPYAENEHFASDVFFIGEQILIAEFEMAEDLVNKLLEREGDG